ncbi:hypothetical protein ACSIGC_11240 [Tenacibaculum sp. ZS6-P6]|uniref:hypothetical protein n=1 Tax=Tenacibaculum sp. ZS6-P6 TaxID=3447503 RepID=UPI003F9AF091
MKKTKEEIKKYFETGDKPTQAEYSDLIDSYIDAKQPVGEPNRRFIIDENGEVSVVSEKVIPEYTLSDITNNKLSLLKDGVVVKQIDLTSYIDDTNLSRLVSGEVNENGIATFKRDDDTVFTIDFSSLITASSATHLSYVSYPTIGEIKSSTGQKAIIRVADKDNAGLMKANFYEQGTFVPQLIDLGGGATYNFTSSITSNYVRVGNSVTFDLTILNLNSSGVPLGGLILNSLPFEVISRSFVFNIGLFEGSNIADSQLNKLLFNSAGNPDQFAFSFIDNAKILSEVTFNEGKIIASGSYITNVYRP